MAIHAGRAALSAATSMPADVGWVIHCGSGYQASAGWPVHHHIQDGIVGSHGNALELRQYCAGGLTSWALAEPMAGSGDAVMCTGADNWSWGDRFVTSRSEGGEPFSDVAHAVMISPRSGFAKILGTATASCPDQSGPWRTRENYWEHAGRDDFRAAYARAVGYRTAERNRESFHMMIRAVTTALSKTGLSPQYVTHFVPHSSGSGEPYRSLAKVVGLPWSESLHHNDLDHGYLGVSSEVAGLFRLAESGELRADSIVLLLAAEFQLSATAVVLAITDPPLLATDGFVRTAA
jgi:3-oxoacyl-[acyl-carrier-protein] synthase III